MFVDEDFVVFIKPHLPCGSKNAFAVIELKDGYAYINVAGNITGYAQPEGEFMIETVLEPSAGKGDLIECLIKAASAGYRRHGRGLNIDCIEIDPYLRQILKYNFSLEATKKQRDRWRDLDQKCHANHA